MLMLAKTCITTVSHFRYKIPTTVATLNSSRIKYTPPFITHVLPPFLTTNIALLQQNYTITYTFLAPKHTYFMYGFYT